MAKGRPAYRNGRLVMLQGTASSVGKSLLTAGLCRILRQDGYRVAPFKAQNMSNNSFVTRDGGEMGRAQVVQAQAAGIEPSVDMNPVLLKPESDARSQVVVLGKAVSTMNARDYYQRKAELMHVVLESLQRLRQQYDVVVIEGAGSPAEINLRNGDLVNMGLATAVDAPVLLVGDIDRGGVFAHLVGTLELLEPEERSLVKGFIINKFRGDMSLLGNALAFLEQRTNIPVLGVVPYMHGHGIPEEDGVVLEQPPALAEPDAAPNVIDIAVLRLPRISNFTDFAPFEREPLVRLRYVSNTSEMGRPDLVILPGTKSTMADLDFLRRQGLDGAVCRLAGQGVLVIGICGGYQMLGTAIRDPLHVESEQDAAHGLGLLPVETLFSAGKRTAQVSARAAATFGPLKAAAGALVTGYEIHNGVTRSDGLSPAFRVVRRSGAEVDDPDGAVDQAGNVIGTYIHGLFDEPGFRQSFLQGIARSKGLARQPVAAPPSLDDIYDRWAAHVRGHLDVGRIYEIAGLEQRGG